MQILTTVSTLNWSEWLRGLIGAFISGGAGAVGAGFGATVLDPSHDLMGLKLVELMGIAFLVSGVISLAKYLQQHPVPDAPKPS